MKRKEWLISGFILLVLAVISVLGTLHVLEMQKPENLRRLTGRFVPLASLGLNGNNDIAITQQDDCVYIAWQAGKEALTVSTSEIPLEKAQQLLVNATLGGTQNGYRLGRWGYRLYMELQTLSNGQVVDSHRIETPFIARREDRGRIFAVQAGAEKADSYRVLFTIEPLDGELTAGQFHIRFWEVETR